jgi:hypothetical protein
MSDVPIISNSERNTFGRCPQRWAWSYIDGLRPKAKPADALWFGQGIHEALALYYNEGFDRGPDPAKTWKQWVGDEIRYIKANYADHDREWFEQPVYEEAGELGQAMLEAYVKEYGDDPYLEILAVEQPFELELVRDDEVIGIFIGIFDGVAIDHWNNIMVLLEHKTAGAIKTMHLGLDNQAGSYFSAATIVLRHQGIIGSKDTIDAILYNFLRKSKPDERPRDSRGQYLNKDGSVSKKQPAKAFVRELVDRTPREVGSQMRRLTNEVYVMNLVREGKLPVNKVVNDMCTYCPFFTMCTMHERGGSAWKEYRDAMYTRTEQSPLRKSAAE